MGIMAADIGTMRYSKRIMGSDTKPEVPSTEMTFTLGPKLSK